jgi:hypothetical protein
MRTKLLLLAALGLFASCKKSGNTNPETPAPETIKEMNFTVTGPKSVSSAPVQQGNGNLNFLGYGYDIIGKYADTSSIRAQVINTTAYAATYPQYIGIDHTTFRGFDKLCGANAEDYLSQISMKVSESQGMNLFKGTITTAFTGQDALSNKYVYAQGVDLKIWKTIGTWWDNSSGYLTPDFRIDVKNLTPENLVKKYGTHILSDISLGEKFSVYFQAKSSDSNKLHSSVVGFDYAYSKVFVNKPGFGDHPNPAEINAISEPKLVYEAIGGDPSKVYTVVTDKGTFVKSDDWFPTCTENNALFVRINRLTPLYNFITDPVKKADVKNYITLYMQQNEVKL